MGQCVYRDQDGRCPETATLEVDSRALGRPDAALEVCDLHYAEVKAYWLEQGKKLDETGLEGYDYETEGLGGT